MELILRTDDEDSIAKILALAKKLNIIIEQREMMKNDGERAEIYKRILAHKASGPSSFGDALEWQLNERKDRDLPFTK